MWLINIIPAPYRLIAGIVALVVTVAAAFESGWIVKGWKVEASLLAEAEAKIEAMQAYDIASRELVKAYQLKQGKTKLVYRTIKEKVNGATTGNVCLNNAAGGLWNDALVGVPSTTTGVTEEASRTYTDTAVLDNAIDNFEQYHECRAQLNALIDWHEKNLKSISNR